MNVCRVDVEGCKGYKTTENGSLVEVPTNPSVVMCLSGVVMLCAGVRPSRRHLITRYSSPIVTSPNISNILNSKAYYALNSSLGDVGQVKRYMVEVVVGAVFLVLCGVVVGCAVLTRRYRNKQVHFILYYYIILCDNIINQ